MKYLLSMLLLSALAAASYSQQPNFGATADIGDREVLIGQPMNTDAPGAVLVFQRSLSGAGWDVNATLTASDGATGDGFGSAISVAGTRMAVGAPGSGDGTGAVYIFDRSPTSGAWTESARLTASALAEGLSLGGSVALDDGRLLASASGSEGGGAVVFTPGADGWEQTAVLEPAEGQDASGFGAGLALGPDRIYVGAPGHGQAGGVYVFSEADGTYERQEVLVHEDGDVFSIGASLELVDGTTLAAGAPGPGPGANMEEGAMPPPGAVVVFEQDEAGAWTSQVIAASTGGAMDFFGMRIASAAGRLYVGAPIAFQAGGAVYAFAKGEDGAWSETGIMRGDDGDQIFGFAVAAANQLVVSTAPGANFGEGAASVLTVDPETGDATKDSRISLVPHIELFASGPVECESGMAGQFACSEVDLLSFMPLDELGAAGSVHLNDIWGWTDPETGREYALVGRSDGTSFVDVTNPMIPVYVGELPLTEGANPNAWRDVKVYRDHAYIVADGAGAHGMQVFDLTQLRDAADIPVTFEESAIYREIFSSHNIVINEQSGYAYAVGSGGGGETCGGGLHMINIQEPANPTFAGCFADEGTGRSGTGYSHDAQCVMYEGPDTEHRGKEICFGSNETALSIADVSDKENPVSLSTASYPNVVYAHQGWLTEDQSHFYMNDELDELDGKTDGTRTMIWDVADLDDPQLVTEHISENKASDHNLYILGNLMYQSNYLSGLRVLDISDVANPVEVGFFDSVPAGTDKPGFGGSWSNYPYFPSGSIVITSMNEGLFVLKKRTVDT